MRFDFGKSGEFHLHCPTAGVIIPVSGGDVRHGNAKPEKVMKTFVVQFRNGPMGTVRFQTVKANDEQGALIRFKELNTSGGKFPMDVIEWSKASVAVKTLFKKKK